jgi:acetyltransferase-like isoleucine patch superfamily enzyme
VNVKLRTLITALVIFFIPRPFKSLILVMLGHSVARGARIGWSLVFVDRLYLEATAKIGSFNLIACRRLVMRSGAYIQRFNVVQGPVSVRLAEQASIGNRNLVRRSWNLTGYGSSQLWLGKLAKITASHVVDCTRAVSFGDYSTLAGKGSQCWTHGFVHESTGPGRARIDGAIRIGNNVYIGSGCVLSMGLRIVDGVTVGSLSSVAKSLLQPGLYVSQPLRFIEKDYDAVVGPLEAVSSAPGADRVFKKRDQS